MEVYNPKKIESKWQEYWGKNDSNKAEDFSKKPKFYALIEFPYPSGAGLHVGHPRGYTAIDIVARKKRMEGYNVMFPIGWDAFGLPTENYAIKMGIHPSIATKENISNFKRQISSFGFSFDWSREINTTDPEYYKWTQWIFLQFYKHAIINGKLVEVKDDDKTAKRLAYQAKIPINWCPSCKIGLANEEAVGGKCERCGAVVEQKTIKQWLLRITEYADRLIDDLKDVDYLEKIKTQQINWIGRSEGTEIKFQIPESQSSINVFTTRVDTIFGVTALVLAPEHPLVSELTTEANKKEVEKYIEESKKKTEFERIEADKEKTGVFTGSYCINPLNKEQVPIWIGDYVVASYGGGAVMTVPAHDFRDFDFAKKYKIEIKEVVSGGDISKEAFVDYGALINSGEFDGLGSKDAIEKIAAWLEKNKLGNKTIKYKLRDWVFSRQHYWGEPIPIVHCEKCGAVPVPEKDLPLELPYVEKYQPTGTGESPLASIFCWVDAKCPKCGGPAKRETDTMPNWAGSSWYFLRYCDAKNDKSFADKKKLEYWMPVDWYNGGFEHTTLHLLYSRFWHKFLFDLGVVPESEPYKKRTSNGVILAEDGRKMSKSFGNVVNPDEIINEFGSDSLRLYEMFMGPFDQAIAWSTNGLKGCYRFLCGLWDFVENVKDKKTKTPNESLAILNKTIKKVSEDIDNVRFNTAVSSLMELMNYFKKNEEISTDDLEKILLIASPFIPHFAEEVWEKLGHKESIFKSAWPKWEEKYIKEARITLIVQINGKMRDSIEADSGIKEERAKELAISTEKVKKWLEGKEIKKVIFVPNKLINIVT
jgi:leucyl-tRNA synthetase